MWNFNPFGGGVNTNGAWWVWAVTITGMMLLMVVGVSLILRCLFAPMSIKRAPTCGGCGHELVDLGAGVCPECGGNLLRCGVVTPKGAVRMRGSAWMVMIGWTLVVLSMVAPGSAFIGTLQNRSQMKAYQAMWNQQATGGTTFTSHSCVLKPSTEYERTLSDSIGWNNRKSKKEKAENPLASFRGRYDSSIEMDEWGLAASGEITISVSHDQELKGRLVVDVTEWKATLFDADEKEIATDLDIDTDTTTRLLELALLDTQHERVQRAAIDITHVLEGSRKDPNNVYGSLMLSSWSSNTPISEFPALQVDQSSTSYGGGVPAGGIAPVKPPSYQWVWLGSLGGTALVYVIGLVVLLAWRGRVVRAA